MMNIDEAEGWLPVFQETTAMSTADVLVRLLGIALPLGILFALGSDVRESVPSEHAPTPKASSHPS